ncbi:MAG: caspase family protein [Betaproteobacteria bacterium]|nr:caspase family protein [Betaproteobacteria bacterium]
MTAPLYAYNDRVALVIGNDQYPNEPLKNAVNDARAMQKALQDLGFKVVFRPNADTVSMRSAAVEFTKILDGATAAVFYYAGHGIQHRDRNYLIPIDAKFTSEAEIAFGGIDVRQIIDYMDDAKVRYKFVILDACRNNPFRNVFTQTGLAKMSSVPPGTVVSFAAAPGAVAYDGDPNAENGIYTKNLLRELRTPGLQATLVFQNAGSAVGQETGGKQLPEFYSTPFPGGKPFFFAEKSALAAAAGAAGGPSADTALQAEREFWASVKDSKRIDDYQAYLEQFPSGVFARLARNRIDDLKREQIQSQVAATPLGAGQAAAPVLVADRAPVTVRPTPVNAAPQPAAPLVTPTASPQVAEARPAPAPVVPAAAPPVQVASAGLPQPAATAATSIAGESRSLESKPAPPPPVQVAALSPEQRTALPPVPQFPKFLTGKIDFADGATYVGEYKEDKDKNQLMHGKGEFVSKAFRYTGEFRDNRKDGRGVHIWANGDKYDGEFIADEPAGRGIWEFASGDRYEGEIARGKFNGKGTLTTKAGDRYTGSFVDSLQQGKGVYVFANGDKYDGEMKAGKLAGQGVYTSKNGDRREATFVDGVAQGVGTYHFSNGDRYEGEFNAGALTGKGKYFYSNGLRTEGNYVNGVLKGQGMFVFNDGSWFEGTFEDGGKAKGVSIGKDGKRTPAIINNGRVEPLPDGK